MFKKLLGYISNKKAHLLFEKDELLKLSWMNEASTLHLVLVHGILNEFTSLVGDIIFWLSFRRYDVHRSWAVVLLSIPLLIKSAFAFLCSFGLFISHSLEILHDLFHLHLECQTLLCSVLRLGLNLCSNLGILVYLWLRQ